MLLTGPTEFEDEMLDALDPDLEEDEEDEEEDEEDEDDEEEG